MSNRFLDEHRRRMGTDDVIRFDEEAIVRLRGRLRVDIAMQVNWSWDYLQQVESLRALYEKGKERQWNAETDVDWSLEVSDDEWVVNPDGTAIGPVLAALGMPEPVRKRAVRDELEYGLSQLLHGEQAALLLTAQIVNGTGDPDLRIFAGQQVADECRHVEVLSKLLARKFGCVQPIDPVIKFLLDEMIESPHWYQKLVGMQLLFEGVAIAILTDIGTNANNALVKQVVKRITQDEARHTAFGVLAMREQIARLSEAERASLELWTWKLVEVVANGLMGGAVRHLAGRYSLDADNLQTLVFAMPQFADARYNLLNHTVIPNLRRLGIVTELTRKNYDQFQLFAPAAPHGSPAIPASLA